MIRAMGLTQFKSMSLAFECTEQLKTMQRIGLRHWWSHIFENFEGLSCLEEIVFDIRISQAKDLTFLSEISSCFSAFDRAANCPELSRLRAIRIVVFCPSAEGSPLVETTCIIGKKLLPFTSERHLLEIYAEPEGNPITPSSTTFD